MLGAEAEAATPPGDVTGSRTALSRKQRMVGVSTHTTWRVLRSLAAKASAAQAKFNPMPVEIGAKLRLQDFALGERLNHSDWGA